MANIYFEFSQNVLDMRLFPSKYVTITAEQYDGIPVRWREYTMNAERVWCEQEGHVWFIKHRHHPSPTVDMQEFMWIKLQAQNI